MSLTDRYIDAVLRRLPNKQRAEIERELRASIADAMEDQSETEVLTELGDPAKLAAGYADRPLQLIGPRFYLDYTRVLSALLATIVPAVAAITGLIRALDAAPVGQIITGTLGAAFTTALHVVFWTTLAFAAIERLPDLQRELSKPWQLSDLPEPPSRKAKFAELVALTVVTVLTASLILLSPRLSWETDANGQPIGVLSPWLWETGMVYVFVAVASTGLLVAFARYYLKWTVPLTIVAALVDMAAPLLLIWLTVTDHVLNPAFVEAAGLSDGTVRVINIVLILTAIGTILSSVIEAFKRVRR